MATDADRTFVDTNILVHNVRRSRFYERIERLTPHSDEELIGIGDRLLAAASIAELKI